MDNIYVIRERIEAVYGKHSKSFDKAFQFILAMITFTMINQNTGFMKSLSAPPDTHNRLIRLEMHI